MALDPTIAAQVAHLFDATLAQVLSGEVQGRPSARRMDRADVVRTVGEIPGAEGPVRVRWYRRRELEGAVPGLVWAHGGGWRYGGIDMPEADSVAQVVAAETGFVVVSVDYRLAPEHHHPAALDDVVAVTDWLLRDGAAHGVEPDRIVLGGASAGAHLALLAALGLAAAGSSPAGLWLAYPVTDPVDGPWNERPPDCPPVIWTDREAILGMFATYLGVPTDEVWRDPAVVPAARRLAGLPPTLVTTAEVDGLRAQGEDLVRRARAAGVEATHHHVEGVLHGYLDTVGDEPLADAALQRHVAWLGALPRSG